jgi:hypothetical protein
MMRKTDKEYLSKFLSKNLPWGKLFATRSNFEDGYLIDEGYFVTKYLKTPSEVLVMGSGNGREARPICRQGHKIVCFDVGGLYCSSGQALFRKEGIRNVYFVEADIFHLPFIESSFDFIFFSLYSTVGERRFEMLKNIRFVLCPSGLVLLGCLTPLYRQQHKKLPLGGYIFISSEAELNNEVSSCGFDLLESRVDAKRPEYRFSILRGKR